MSSLIPFMKTISDLEDERRTLADIDPAKAAATLNDLKKTIEATQKNFESATEKPKRTVSAETRAKMIAGQRRAAERRKAATMKEPAVKKPELETDSLDGLTADDCADACRDGYCVITGFNHCGHPYKGGIQAAHKMNPEIKVRYNRAKKRLDHLAVEKKVV